MEVNYGSDLSAASLRVFETLPNLYLILSPSLIMLTASDQYLAATSKTRAELQGKYIFDVFNFGVDGAGPDDGIRQSLEYVIAHKQSHQLPVTRFDIPGKKPREILETYWYTSNSPVFNEAGALSYIIHHTENVTQRVLGERRLKSSLIQQTKSAAKATQLGARIEKLFSEIPARIAIMGGPSFVFEFVNGHYQTFFNGRQLLGLPLADALPELAGYSLLTSLKHVYDTGESFEGREIYMPLSRGDGLPTEDHYLNFIYQARLDEDGKINGILSFAYDVTELVKARLQLEQNTGELLTLNHELLLANMKILTTSEEVQASSEEIQSTNEKLTATNEQLHQAQESLIRLNNSLESKVESRTAEVQAAQMEAENQRDRLTRFFLQAPAGICILDGPDFVFELVNPSYQQFFADRDLVGKPLIIALPELESHPVYGILKDVYDTGNTFEGHELMVPVAYADGGAIEDRYFNFIYQARRSGKGDIDGVLVFAFEVTETVRTRQQEIENEKRFLFMLNAIPQQVWTASPDGVLDYVNEVVCNDFGYGKDEIVGHGWHAFIHPEDLQGFMENWAGALASEKIFTMEFRLRFHDQNYRWHLARALPLIEDGNIKLWLGTNTDIDLQKNNEQRKDEFLSIASHELKTPLTSIKAFNQLAQRSREPDKLISFAQKSAQHIYRLERLISDLLDVTKITAGKMVYTMEEFNFPQMLRDSMDGVQHATTSHQIILESAEDITFTGDRLRLEQVVNNFINNAIKYSPEGDKVVVNCYTRDANVVVSVQDFGIGIAEQNLHRLFERYYRVDNTAMRFEGLGLGLFISSEILKRHNGSFWIESEPGDGSTFFFCLPLKDEGETKTIVRFDEFYEDVSIRIQYNQEYQHIDAVWKRFQNLQSVQRGCMRILDMVVKNQATKVVNDNTLVMGSWTEASDWVSQTYFPMMEKAGVKYLAWIYSANVFSQLSAKKSVDTAVSNIITQFFTDIVSAENWINNK